MKTEINRRQFLQQTAAGAFALTCPNVLAFGLSKTKSPLVTPVWQRSKVKVARLYMANTEQGGVTGLWPKPDLDLKKEIKFYESQFTKISKEISDIDFVIDQLVGSPEQVAGLKDKLQDIDGILVIHLNLNIRPVLEEIMKLNAPTMIFAAPYSGHEWTAFGSLRKDHKMDCILTSDYTQLALALKPFRAIRHLKESKILDVTDNLPPEYAANVKKKFGTKIIQINLQQMLDAYNSVDDKESKAETSRWIKDAEKVVEPPKDEIHKSCRLALAFQKLLEQQNANVITVDCYGSMYHKLPAFPCVGFTRLNDMGLGGICESDLRCAMTHLILQGLTGKPSFISDPTFDVSNNSIILAHCLGSTRMDGPESKAAPYKLRTIMERREGVVPQVKMKIGRKVTQTLLVGTERMPYFTGTIIDSPVDVRFDRGCRTKIVVQVDGDAEKLWQNWSDGLHRQTCYGIVTKELGYYCKLNDIKLFNQAV